MEKELKNIYIATQTGELTNSKAINTPPLHKFVGNESGLKVSRLCQGTCFYPILGYNSVLGAGYQPVLGTGVTWLYFTPYHGTFLYSVLGYIKSGILSA